KKPPPRSDAAHPTSPGPDLSSSPMPEHQDARSADATPLQRLSAAGTPPVSATRSYSGDVPRETVSKPLLASEALMDDLAPGGPARRAARFWGAALAVGWGVLAALPLLGVRAGGSQAAVPALVLAGVAFVAALARVTYRQRAVAMVTLGVLSAALGFWG